MNPVLVAPAVMALAALGTLAPLRRRLAPRAAMVTLTLASLFAAGALLGALALVGVAAFFGSAYPDWGLTWCKHLLIDGHQVPFVWGALAGVVGTTGLVRGLRFELRWRQTLRRHRQADRLTVLDTSERVAYSVPTRHGAVVVSKGLLGVLGSAEQAALMAHERCHLARGHHLFLHVSGLCAAVVPGLGWLARQVRIATEREADEAAARAVGDRRIVARAIALAVGPPPPLGTAGAGDSAVVERVQALLQPGSVAWLGLAATLTALVAALTALGGSTLQLHHLVEFVAHVCRV